MKHYIISKFKPEISKEEKSGFIGPITELFNRILDIEGIHSVNVYPNCVDRDNRYDLMIEIDMDREALEKYDASEPHHEWKRIYGDMLEKKTIFDRE